MTNDVIHTFLKNMVGTVSIMALVPPVYKPTSPTVEVKELFTGNKKFYKLKLRDSIYLIVEWEPAQTEKLINVWISLHGQPPQYSNERGKVTQRILRWAADWTGDTPLTAAFQLIDNLRFTYDNGSLWQDPATNRRKHLRYFYDKLNYVLYIEYETEQPQAGTGEYTSIMSYQANGFSTSGKCTNPTYVKQLKRVNQTDPKSKALIDAFAGTLELALTCLTDIGGKQLP